VRDLYAHLMDQRLRPRVQLDALLGQDRRGRQDAEQRLREPVQLEPRGLAAGEDAEFTANCIAGAGRLS
jgi:hypothetical protein